MDHVEEKFDALTRRTDAPTHAELEDLWAAAAPVDEAFMLGDWEGHVFGTGHPAEVQLTALRWVGKCFRSREDVDPIVSLDDSGERVANPTLGAARLRTVVYQGSATATMVYDNHPILDHFRRIADGIAMGAMDRKGARGPGFFYLTRR